ncbi:MAG: hypothetical protein JWP69_552 [Flaviaesturariibacter sp.]|nr:hypothetical protein [Flaviaesturariibacter sp.]
MKNLLMMPLKGATQANSYLSIGMYTPYTFYSFCGIYGIL